MYNVDQIIAVNGVVTEYMYNSKDCTLLMTENRLIETWLRSRLHIFEGTTFIFFTNFQTFFPLKFLIFSYELKQGSLYSFVMKS